jgi:hypothetical protein
VREDLEFAGEVVDIWNSRLAAGRELFLIIMVIISPYRVRAFSARGIRNATSVSATSVSEPGSTATCLVKAAH